MSLKELLGESYKDGMSFEEIETALSSRKLVDLESGDYVSKGKLTDALNKVKLAEDKVTNISKEFNDYKALKMTDEEKANEKAKQDADTLNSIMEENRRYKLKDKLYGSGYTTDEIQQLLDNDMSPETFASISAKRVEDALKKDKIKGIKDTARVPSADKGTDGIMPEITKEQFNKMSYNERVNLFKTDIETYNKLTKEK